MNQRYKIRSIQPGEVTQARQLIYSIARDLFHPEMSVAQATAYWDARGTLADLDDLQKNYIEKGGIFLMPVVAGHMEEKGTFCRYGEGVCELKRLWFLPQYQGRGLGYAMLAELIRRARGLGYIRMCLLTDRYSQSRAVAFYHQVGFVDVPRDGLGEEDLRMEMTIE